MKKKMTKRQETYMVKKFNELMIQIGRDEECVEFIYMFDSDDRIMHCPQRKQDYTLGDLIEVCKCCIGYYFEDGHVWHDDYRNDEDGHTRREITALKSFINKYRPYAVKANHKHY